MSGEIVLTAGVRLWLWIDPTRRCNLACRLCYTKASHAPVDLEPSVLSRMLDNLVSEPRLDLQVVHMNWRGEPLMNPALPELLRITSERLPGVPLHWHTNGLLLDEETARTIFATTHPHTIYVSVDGGSEASHDRNRGRGTFRRALQGLRAALRARSPSSHHRLGIYQLDLGEPEDRYDAEFVSLAGAVDDWVRVYPVLPDGDESAFPSEPRQPGGSPLVEAWPRRTLKAPIPRGPCFWAGHALCADPRGLVSVCLVSHDASGVVGDLVNEPVWTIVQRARAFRQGLVQCGRGNTPHCAQCRKPEGQPHSAPLVSLAAR